MTEENVNQIIPNASDSVVTPNILSSQPVNDVFDELINETVNIERDDSNNQPNNDKQDDGEQKPKDIFNELVLEEIGANDDEGSDGDEQNVPDSTKYSRGNANKAIKKLIDEGILLPFDEDDKPIEKYNADDISELIKANIETKIEEVTKNTIEEFIKTQPTELQILLKYVNEGGNDMKQILTLLNKVSDISSLQVGRDDEFIVRLYLQNTNYGDDNDIEEQIQLLKDTGKLNDYANKFKPKLDEMQQQVVEKELKKQEELKKQQEEFARKYVSEVNKALSDKKINDVVLPPKKVNDLISGLTSVQYESISGRKTNKLGYLLEKYQFKEPNLKLISEVLWLLDNPDEYKKMLIDKGKQEAERDMKLKLKTEQGRNKANMNLDVDNNNKIDKVKRTISRNGGTNFFSR